MTSVHDTGGHLDLWNVVIAHAPACSIFMTFYRAREGRSGTLFIVV